MTMFLATFIVIGIAILAMAVGIMVGRRPIGGSCGGLERLGLECDAGCDKPCPERLALILHPDARSLADSSDATHEA